MHLNTDFSFKLGGPNRDFAAAQALDGDLFSCRKPSLRSKPEPSQDDSH